jgi:hypothetical protein
MPLPSPSPAPVNSQPRKHPSCWLGPSCSRSAARSRGWDCLYMGQHTRRSVLQHMHSERCNRFAGQRSTRKHKQSPAAGTCAGLPRQRNSRLKAPMASRLQYNRIPRSVTHRRARRGHRGQCRRLAPCWCRPHAATPPAAQDEGLPACHDVPASTETPECRP